MPKRCARKSLRVATTHEDVETMQQNANANTSDCEGEKCNENGTEANVGTTSLLSIASAMGGGLATRKKRTTVHRKRLPEANEYAKRLARLLVPVVLQPTPEAMNRSSNVRHVINPDSPNDENEPKRRRVSPSTQQVATPGGPDGGPGLTNLASSRRKRSMDQRNSSIRHNKGVRHAGVNPSGEAQDTSVNKHEPNQLETQRQRQQPLPPQPQPWPPLSPSWVQSQPYNQPFINVGSSSTNDADYKGKKVVVDDGNDKRGKWGLDNLDFLFGNFKGGVKIREGTNENAASHKGSYPPSGDHNYFRNFINEFREGNNKPVHGVQVGIDRGEACVVDANGEQNLVYGKAAGGGNQKIINETGSFMPGNQGASNQSNPKNTGTKEVCEKMNMYNILVANQRKKAKSRTSVVPSTYLRPPRRNSSSLLSRGGASSSVGLPPTHGVQPPALLDAQKFKRPELGRPLLNWGPPSQVLCGFMKFQNQEPAQLLPLSGPPPPAVLDSSELRIQDYAEAIYGKEVFSKGQPPIVGPHTALMALAQDPSKKALSSFMNSTQSPPLSAPETTTITTYSQQLQPPPPVFTASGDDVTGEQEPELASASCIRTPIPEPNHSFLNSWAAYNPNQFLPPDAYGTVQQQPVDNGQPQLQQLPGQLASNPLLFDRDFLHQQANLFMPMPVPLQLQPQMTMFGVPNFPGQNLQGNPGTSGNRWQDSFMFDKCGYQGPPPPGF